MPISLGKTTVNEPTYGQQTLSHISLGSAIVYSKYPIYEFIIDQTTDTPSEMIQYIGYNKDFLPAHMDYDQGVFDYGSWKDSWLLNKFRPCMLHANGEVAYYLNKENLTQKEDGSDAMSDLTSDTHDMNAMVEVGQIWIKEEVIDDDHFHISLSPMERIDYDCWTHYNVNNKRVAYYYHGMYNGSLDSNKKMRSLSGKMPNVSVPTVTQQREYCQANGNGWDYREWSFQRLMIYILWMLGKSTNPQVIFGNGKSMIGKSDTPDMTGGIESKGWFYGSDTTTEAVTVFGMENFYGNVFSTIHGLQTYDSQNIYIKMTPGTADGSKGSDYSLNPVTDFIPLSRNTIGMGETMKTGVVKKINIIPKYGPFGKEWYDETNFDLGYCDYNDFEITHCIARVAGGYRKGKLTGPFYIMVVIPNEWESDDFGCSLIYKQT